MAIKIQNLTKWAQLPPGQALKLAATDTRKVRLDVNCPEPTRFDAVVGDKPFFLAVVTGLETLEFTIERDCEVLATTDGEVWYFTNENGDMPFEVPEAVSFVSIMNRRARNPQLEMMMFKAEQNMNRRLDALAGEFEARVAALGHNPDTGEVNDEAEDSALDTGGDEGTEPVEPGPTEPSATGKTTGTTGTGSGLPA